MQVSVPPTVLAAGVVQFPPPVTALSEMNAALVGSVSVATTLEAVDGPLLRAVIT